MTEINKVKYENVILFLCKGLGGHIEGKKKLAKLLYYVDFDFFEYKESMKSLTGDTYVAWKMGPVPNAFVSMLDEMKANNTIAVATQEVGQDYNPMEIYSNTKDPDMSVFNEVPFVFPEEPHIKTKLGDILEKNVDKKYTISDTLWAGHQRRKKEHKEKGNGFGYSMFNEESEYTSTISARYYKDGSEILIEQKDQNPRKLTPREAARLQGFPDTFILPNSDAQTYKQFGNSVAVPVIKVLAKEIIKSIKNSSKII